MRKLLILLILLTFPLPIYAATIYKWVDKESVVNITDDYNKIPYEYRDRIEVEVKEDAPKVGTLAAPETPIQKSEEVKTDIYGRDETWWRGKVRPLKEKLKEATVDHDKVHKKFMEKAEELSRMRYGSKAQYKLKIIELDRANEEMVKYEAQIAETNEMLKKLSKEAEESKANPDWLKGM